MPNRTLGYSIPTNPEARKQEEEKVIQGTVKMERRGFLCPIKLKRLGVFQ
jgi:hypothetical protein